MNAWWYETTHTLPDFDISKMDNVGEFSVKLTPIADSGEHREFDTGAVRDISDHKGRCDLMPLEIVGRVLNSDFLVMMDKVIRYGDEKELLTAIRHIVSKYFGNEYTAMIEVSKHFEDGCRKYGERNWEKGIPVHSFVDSATRHYLKHERGDTDEPHDRAYLWNLLCLWWTMKNKPELNDLPCGKEKE